MLRVLREAKARQQSCTEQEYRDILAASQGFTPPNPTPIDIRRPLNFQDKETPQPGEAVQPFPSPPAFPASAADGTPGGLVARAPAGDRELPAGSGGIAPVVANLGYGISGGSAAGGAPGTGSVPASVEGTWHRSHAVGDIEDLGGSFALQNQRSKRVSHHRTCLQQESEAVLQVWLVQDRIPLLVSQLPLSWFFFPLLLGEACKIGEACLMVFT